MRSTAAAAIGVRCNGMQAGEVLGFWWRAVRAIRNATRASDCCDNDTIRTTTDQP